MLEEHILLYEREVELKTLSSTLPCDTKSGLLLGLIGFLINVSGFRLSFLVLKYLKGLIKEIPN